MNKQTEALKMAIEAMCDFDYDKRLEAIKFCKEALEQPAQHKWSADGERCVKCGDKDWMGGSCSVPDEQPAQEPVAWGNPTYNYAVHHKVAPSWQGLSNDRIREIGDNCLENNNGLFNWIDFSRAIEQALKEKNT